MPTEAKPHAILRIRRALEALPEESGARELSKVKKFAAWVGCSESLIRNIENGVVASVSDKLARAIESKTGVSADWIQSSPEEEDPMRTAGQRKVLLLMTGLPHRLLPMTSL